MGLGAPKRRNKLSHDPNNTAWTRSTSNFGHRILSQQGWQPGQFLGAENANHSDHYTAANASHIRIALREDNLGLGAKVGGNKAETFGLSLFSGVLGRLNGKSDEQVEKQQHALRDAELRQYQVGKYGLMNFVSGGLLVGDRIEKPGEKAAVQTQQILERADGSSQRGKKRKADPTERDGDKAEKKRRRSLRDTEEDEFAKLSEIGEDGTQEDSRVKEKKRRKARQSADQSEEGTTRDNASEVKRSKERERKSDSIRHSSSKVSADEKARLKQEKRARKEDRRRRKEEKRRKKDTSKTSPQADVNEKTRHTDPSAQIAQGGRYAVRHRYIQQKRMAGMDAQAMKEIFMVKATA